MTKTFTVEPELTTMFIISLTNFHEIDENRAAKYRALIESGSPIPPVLVMNDGYQKLILDGHHRVAAAAAAGLVEVPAYYINPWQAEQMRDECFDGEWSEQYCDCDPYIVIDGKPYSEIRVVD